LEKTYNQNQRQPLEKTYNQNQRQPLEPKNPWRKNQVWNKNQPLSTQLIQTIKTPQQKLETNPYELDSYEFNALMDDNLSYFLELMKSLMNNEESLNGIFSQLNTINSSTLLSQLKKLIISILIEFKRKMSSPDTFFEFLKSFNVVIKKLTQNPSQISIKLVTMLVESNLIEDTLTTDEKREIRYNEPIVDTIAEFLFRLVQSPTQYRSFFEKFLKLENILKKMGPNLIVLLKKPHKNIEDFKNLCLRPFLEIIIGSNIR
jgi:hypothetical protein